MKPEELSDHLSERIRPLQPHPPGAGGKFVLYWMHHAVRTDENPALDVAACVAAAAGLPLLVYQGLGGAHRYNSDRHHTFILEGARDVAQALAVRGIRYAFHLSRQRNASSPLASLAARAALVVTEDFPAPPMPAWTQALAERVAAPVWCVDTACVMPMQRAARAYERAFEFRRAHGQELLERAERAWPACGAEPRMFHGKLGFEPLEFENIDISATCAACEIDHSVGPVPDTPGGSSAALARWSAFLDAGLNNYDRLRNDAAVQPPEGVSRLSPYLHHGHISPLRVARDAARRGGRGADKFLDELLIWRELAHNFCFHNEHRSGGLESLERLPAWARATLEAHADDSRPGLRNPEDLTRGRTGDTLWDAAQRSLLVHGELHNNLRMTWGKAIIKWTESPEAALATLIDLNHRYALDGNDPNSYGGLLYCLGLFDRAFTPTQKVTGSVRARSTSAHAKRLDAADFSARMNTRRSSRGTPLRAAVVGAGVAGLAAARTLVDQGFGVQVFDRGRAVGGRLATRRRDGHQFDHGAQYFTATDVRFARLVEMWQRAGIVAPWCGHLVCLDGTNTRQEETATRYVALPGMRALAAHLAADLDVVTACTVDGLQRAAHAWAVVMADGSSAGPFEAAVVAMPQAQAARLSLPDGVAQDASCGASLPSWCAMAAFDRSLGVQFDGAFVDNGPIAWIARDSSKPGRPGGERWVIHAGPQWSAPRLDMGPDQVAGELLEAFFETLGRAPREPTHLAGHRWSLARPASPTNGGCLWDAEHALAYCGDWCGDGQVEGAWLSGVAAAGRIAAAASRW